jgi:hypothetical protein
MLIDSLGGKGTGIEAGGSNFPFVAPGDDVRGLLADFWLAHEVHRAVLPLRVTRLTNFDKAFAGLPSKAGVQVLDAADLVVFDSTGSAYRWRDWGSRLRVHEWLKGAAVCRAVQHRASAEPRAPFPAAIVPQSGALDERTSYLLPRRVRRLIDAATDTPVSGAIRLVGGWNVAFATAPRPAGLRLATTVTISAAPGEGLGRAPGCPDSDADRVLRKLGGVGPDEHGNVSLMADGCYHVRQPLAIGGTPALAVPTPATLALGNDCGPCCVCDDFVNVQQAVLNLEARIRGTADEAESVRDEFAAARQRWQAARACQESHLIKLSALPHSQRYVEISAAICNGTPRCLHSATLALTLTSGAASWIVSPGTTRITDVRGRQQVYTLGGAPPTVTAAFDMIQPMANGRVRVRAELTTIPPAGQPVRLDASMTTTDPDFGLPAQAAFVETAF